MLHHQEGKLARDWVETKKSSTALLSWLHSISVQIEPDGERRVACVPECLEKPHGNDLYEIYKMLKESNNIGYSLFDKNIREYLGITGKRGKTNKDIKKTLLDPIERNRFFYYNNGITMICDDFHSYQKNKKTTLTVSHPQIVNGCQTVNTIFYTIKDLFDGKNISEVAASFKHCSILVKIFKINKTDDADLKIYENIVKYTNTQTSITAKDFVSKDNYFLNLQEDFLKRGFYLIVKQSDKHKFESDEPLFNKCKDLANEKCSVFGIEIVKPKDLFIELDKLLKVFVAFYFDGYIAYKNGSSTLNEHSVKYYMNFSKNIRDYFTTDNMINLFLIYIRAGGKLSKGVNNLGENVSLTTDEYSEYK